jgi:hypothetical protein
MRTDGWPLFFIWTGMLKSLAIQNFRGIDALAFDDFSTINIFVGSNGAGKTSMLEACALAADPFAVQLLTAFSAWREMPPLNARSDDGIRTLFPDLNILRSPKFSFATSKGAAVLEIRALRLDQHLVPRPSGSSASAPLPDADALGGIQVVLMRNGQDAGSLTLTLTEQGAHVHLNSVPPRELGAFYIHSRRTTSATETAALLTNLYERKAESQLMAALQKIDHRLKRLQPGLRTNIPLILADVGGNRMVPMNVLGDGFCRVSLMLTGILWEGAKVTVIDEIDSGLHHSVMTDFWKSSVDLMLEKGNQLFCVTHSDEMLMKSLDAFTRTPTALRIFRIERSSNGALAAAKYTYETYKAAVLSGDEIR